MVSRLFMAVVSIKHFIFVITLVFLFSCKEEPVITHKITGKQLNISNNVAADTAISTFIAPYEDHLNKVLDSPLAYAPVALSKSGETLNTAMGNLMADIVFEQSNPVFKKRTGKTIDFVLLNYGGIRSGISKGTVTRRTAYEVMPFENKVVVLELSPKKIEEMLLYLAKGRRAHPVSSQLNIILNANYTLKNVSLNQKPLEKNRNYYVATSDYLMEGGDNMYFFSDPVSVTELDYNIRNTLIDYFNKTDTITAVTDHRFIKME